MNLTKCILGFVAIALMVLDSSVASEDDMNDLKTVLEGLRDRVDALESEIEKVKRSSGGRNGETEARIGELETHINATPEPNDFNVYWREGLRFDTRDGRFKIRIRGRFQQDWAWFDQDESLEFVWDPIAQAGVFAEVDDGTEMRRGWLELNGNIYDDLRFAMQLDFANGDTDFLDLFLELRDVPYAGNVRAGHFREPIGMEQLTSSKYLTFMERALPAALAPGWNSGVMLYDTLANGRVTWAAGVFKEVDSVGTGEGDGQSSVTARVTGLPVYTDGGRRLVHLGAAYSVRNVDDTVRFRTRPESNLAPHFIDTGAVYTGHYNVLGLEAAAVWGPFSIQAEYLGARGIGNQFSGRRDYDGFHLQASYFLTGEHRTYNQECAVWDQIVPNREFSLRRGSRRGWGAWEVALRYSEIDLDSAHSFPGGGSEDNRAIALNWYLNANMRVMLNYVNADITHPLYGGELNLFQTRFQLAF